jgi:hypothetical protein
MFIQWRLADRSEPGGRGYLGLVHDHPAIRRGQNRIQTPFCHGVEVSDAVRRGQQRLAPASAIMRTRAQAGRGDHRAKYDGFARTDTNRYGLTYLKRDPSRNGAYPGLGDNQPAGSPAFSSLTRFWIRQANGNLMGPFQLDLFEISDRLSPPLAAGSASAEAHALAKGNVR